MQIPSAEQGAGGDTRKQHDGDAMMEANLFAAKLERFWSSHLKFLFVAESENCDVREKLGRRVSSLHANEEKPFRAPRLSGEERRAIQMSVKFFRSI
jgi:hypothetical protein